MSVHRELHLTRAVEKVLTEYTWPGNGRELENALPRAAVLSRGSTIAVEYLSLEGTTGSTCARSHGSDDLD
jgi:DNA-binding NtrC family response regulator